MMTNGTVVLVTGFDSEFVCVVGQIFALKDPSLKNKSSPHHVFKSYGFDMKKMIHCNYIDIKYNSRESTGLEYH